MCILFYDLRECIFQCFTKVLYENEESIMTYGAKLATLQAQVEGLESVSAEKDASIAEYEARVKGSEGKCF